MAAAARTRSWQLWRLKLPGGGGSESRPRSVLATRWFEIAFADRFGTSTVKRTRAIQHMTSSSASSRAPQTPPSSTLDRPCNKPSPRRSIAERSLIGILVLAVDAYRVALSPLFRGSCRYDPSCSQFAREALLKHGAQGIALSVRRILRCRPYGGFGFDPVP